MIHGAVSGNCLREVARDVPGPSEGCRYIEKVLYSIQAIHCVLFGHLWGHFSSTDDCRSYISNVFVSGCIQRSNNPPVWAPVVQFTHTFLVYMLFSLCNTAMLPKITHTYLGGIPLLNNNTGRVFVARSEWENSYHLSQSRRKSVPTED